MSRPRRGVGTFRLAACRQKVQNVVHETGFACQGGLQSACHGCKLASDSYTHVLSVDPQGYDILEDMYSPKTAVANFAHELCRKKKCHLDAFMMQIVQVGSQVACSARGEGSWAFTAVRRMISLARDVSLQGGLHGGDLAQQAGSVGPVLRASCFQPSRPCMLLMLVQVLNSHQAQVTAGTVTKEAAWRMDGAMLAVGVMVDLLKNKVRTTQGGRHSI